MFEILTLISLVVLLIVREVTHARTVQDLALEIKAASVQEYVQAKKELAESPDATPPAEAPIPFEQLEPEEALAAVRRTLED